MGVNVRAYSKINLRLEVLGKRDDGYHEVWMVMQMLRLWDNVYLASSRRNRIFSNHEFVPNNRNNLAMKAAELMQAQYHMPPVDITIQKNIPVSAGMAGGSSDAAAVLLGMRELFDQRITIEELCTLGEKLGSDVPFCVMGPTALAYGRGEKITSLSSPQKLYVLIIKANFGVSTAKIYQQFDLSKKVKGDYLAFKQAIEEKNIDYILANLSNDLETTTFSLYPKVELTKRDLLNRGIRHVLMSGSGPTVFGLFKTSEEAMYWFKVLQKDYPHILLTTTLVPEDLGDRVLRCDD